MNKETLKSKIRPVTEEDKKNLKAYSYSGLSTLKTCPYQFYLNYIEGKRSSDTSLALQLGTLLHYILEQKGKMIVSGEGIDYPKLYNIQLNGMKEVDGEKTKEEIIGLNDLKKTYWEEWGVPDTEGRTYNDKLVNFDKVLANEMQNTEWKPYLFEHYFEFVYDNKIILHGFIDRVDKKDEALRVIDYKTNKKLYDKKDLPTSLQFGIYALAILNEFDIIPEQFIYRMILLDDSQEALTPGWEDRLVTQLDKIVKSLETHKESGTWEPKPCPLCHWCNYCATNGNAKQYKNECQYYSLWTPEHKTFEVNKEFNIFENKEEKNNQGVDKPRRTVVF